MEIKTTQLKSNTQIAETPVSTTRTPAKSVDSGKTFIDEMSNLPKLEQTDVKVSSTDVGDVKSDSKTDVKPFEFVSLSENDFKSEINKGKVLSADERQERHRVAEKELVDEIVLMNNKQNSDVKQNKDFNSAKTQLADAKNLNMDVDNDFVDEKHVQKAIDIETVNTKPIQKNIEMENEETMQVLKTTELENSEKIIVSDDVSNEIILPDKNVAEEIFAAPEKLEQFEEPENIVKHELKIDDVAKDKIKSNEIEKNIVKNDIAHDESNILPEQIKSEEKIVDVHKFDKNDKFEKLNENKTDIDSIKSEEKIVDVHKFDKNDKFVKLEDNNVKSEKVLAERQDIKSGKTEYAKNITKEEVKIQNADDAQAQNVAEIELAQNVKSFEIPDKIAAVGNVVNQNKIDEKKDLKADKSSLSKISNVAKNDVTTDFENIGKVKDIADEVKVEAVNVKIPVPEDIKVIKMEVINPLAELNNSLNTNKTSDIVKFIDANLSTETTKSSKLSSSKSADISKKAAEKAIKMTEADAKFFNNLIETNQQVIEGTKTAEQANNNLLKDVETAHSAQVSKTLLNALKESQENNKAFRVDFDKDISVILRVNKDGQIAAEFIPGDEAVEQYLKANIPLLKQKFTDEGLEYDNLSYRQNKKQNEEKERQNRGNKKENGYE